MVDETTLADKLVGKMVEVDSVHYSDFEHNIRTGKIDSIDPRMSLGLRDGDDGHIVFVGVVEGIYSIRDRKTHQLYYSNTTMFDFLKSLRPSKLRGYIEEETNRDELRKVGVFYG
nr:hypothetical protein [Nanoarchaeum sp.]